MLWVTTFNKELFDASGKRLLESHINFKCEGDWYIGLENVFSDKLPEPINLQGRGINLICSDYLSRWLDRNLDISPPKPCHCRDPWARKESDHIKNCPHTWFNRNTYKWMRKIATLYHAHEYAVRKGYRYINWIDSDCEFIFRTFFGTIHAIYGTDGYDMLYLKGSDRKVMEAGFVSYDISSPATNTFLLGLFNFYMSGEFRSLARWDDSYIIQKLIEKDDCLKAKDIATTISDKWSGVFQNSEIGNYIKHNKGRHGRKLGIMK